MQPQMSSLLSLGEQDSRPVLHLFSNPFVTVGARKVDIPEGSKRVLAYVALKQGAINRRQVAGTLWPLGSEARAAGNLRSALWRLNTTGISLLRLNKHSMMLSDELLVDSRLATEWASRLISGNDTDHDLCIVPWLLGQTELLPGWYDDWALLERERVTQRLLHAFEILSRRFIRRGRYGEAVEAALVATGVDPLRESAQHCLIGAHLAEGNISAANRSLAAYRALLQRELGVEPSPRLLAVFQDNWTAHPETQQRIMSHGD